MKLLLLRTAAASVLFTAACGDGPPRAVAPPVCEGSAGGAIAPIMAAGVVPDTSAYDALFREAAAAHGVPESLLRAIGYVETRWQMVDGHEEFAGQPTAHGVMALRGERLRTAARLAGVREADVRGDARANIRAAAALLRSYADDRGIGGGDEAAWMPAVGHFSGIALAAGQAGYVRDVYAVLGGRRAAPSRAALDPCGTTPAPPPPAPPPAVDQAGARWFPSPNYNDRMASDGGRIHMVIIHSCEGSYTGCWSWLANSASQVSAHYVVREDGAEITQLVREASRAWHIAATYDSTLNGNHDGRLHGVQSNHFTVGVEHAGFASQTAWPVEQIEASARLVCGIAKRWQIPPDQLHIVSHGRLQPYNRTDPGAGWPWADYLARIDRHCAA